LRVHITKKGGDGGEGGALFGGGGRKKCHGGKERGDPKMDLKGKELSPIRGGGTLPGREKVVDGED